jgi:hypothetical protein
VWCEADNQTEQRERNATSITRLVALATTCLAGLIAGARGEVSPGRVKGMEVVVPGPWLEVAHGSVVQAWETRVQRETLTDGTLSCSPCS